MYGLEDKLPAIVFSLGMLLLAAGVRFVAGTFLVPAGIFALAWFAFTFLPLVLLFSTPINSYAIFYILVAALVFALSALPFDWRLALRQNCSKSLAAVRFDSWFLRFVLFASVTTSVVLSVSTMLINGFTLDQVVFDLLRTSGQYAAVRGTDGVGYGLVGTLSTMFTYLCPVLGGLRAFAPRRKLFFAIALLPSLLTMVIQSSKLVFLVSLCLYAAGALVAKFYDRQLGLPKITGLPKFILGAVVLSSLVLISFVSRLGEVDLENLGAFTEPLRFSILSYTMGQVYAFADFFSYAIGHPSNTLFKNEFYSYGAYTFASIFDTLGIGKVFPPGMYEESGWHKDWFETNIFTFFRGLIYDFGIIGSLCFVFVFGMLAHAVTYRVLMRQTSWLAVATMVAITVFILMGYLFSVFVARYIFLNAAAIWLLLSINERICSERDRAS